MMMVRSFCSVNKKLKVGRGILAEPKRITVRSTAGEKFETITRYELGERPEREPGDDSAEVAMSGEDPHVEDFDPDDIPF